MTASIAPFTLAIPETDLADLRSRIGAVRWPSADPSGDWSRGVPLDYLRGLAAHWAHGFDWRKTEAALNKFAQFTTEIDGQTFHFVHVRSPVKNARALLLCHGWPGSFVEYERVIGPLSDPVAYGGKADDAFDIVIPSPPGFGFSMPLAGPGWNMPRITQAYAVLMERLGYARYAVHGSDIGSGIAGHLAASFADRVAAIHVASDRGTLIYAGVFLPLPADLSDKEKADLDSIKALGRDGDGYMRQQSTKPQTLAYGLADSPTAQLAWIVEKFREWTDPKKALPEEAVDREQLLADVSLYWFTNTGGSSAQFYWEAAHGTAGWLAPSDVPQGWSVFNTHPLVRRIVDPAGKYAWFDHAEGGHFPAMEQPGLLVDDIRTFFRTRR